MTLSKSRPEAIYVTHTQTHTHASCQARLPPQRDAVTPSELKTSPDILCQHCCRAFKCSPQSNWLGNIIPATQEVHCGRDQAAWVRRGGGHVAWPRESLNMNTQSRTRSAFEYRWPYMRAAFHCRQNYLHRIWTAAPGWGCHGDWAPAVRQSLLRTQILKIWVVFFLFYFFAEIGGKNVVLLRCRFKLQLQGREVI